MTRRCRITAISRPVSGWSCRKASVRAALTFMLLVASVGPAVASPLQGTWEGFALLLQDGDLIATATVHIVVGEGGQIRGKAELDASVTYALVGNVKANHDVILSALPAASDDHGALFFGSAYACDNSTRLNMFLSSVPFTRLQMWLYLSLAPEPAAANN